MTRIKICGITNEKDALWASNAGVDFIGLNFYKNSPRKISIDMAKRITTKLPEFVKSVGIFVDEEISFVLKTVKKLQLKLVQLHGNESPEYCDELKNKISESVPPDTLWENRTQIIKAFRICNDYVIENINNFKNVDYYLLDTFVENIPGGTGEVFNWDLAIEIKKLGKSVFLSGGLNPDNITAAIGKVEPYAVDVCSGIERTPTRKDYDKMLAFIKAVRKI
ncbi:MAG TPA: phosphoribosylanthranilate isomerase [Elusimicrobia bacterium]|nr:MAG: hypothetical protein A2551_06225 [Elusimicrobia bacterium RIFOXYD2_FULL_34_30]HAM39188.1 phosphoribosylanthranilate isomerase [Elusimicrobiota bacterium]